MSRIVTYSDFKRAFEQLDDASLMRPGKKGDPLHDLTMFSRTNPKLYAEYKERMHNENHFQHNKDVMDKEYW